jgi:hypothetical protein
MFADICVLLCSIYFQVSENKDVFGQNISHVALLFFPRAFCSMNLSRATAYKRRLSCLNTR